MTRWRRLYRPPLLVTEEDARRVLRKFRPMSRWPKRGKPLTKEDVEDALRYNREFSRPASWSFCFEHFRRFRANHVMWAGGRTKLMFVGNAVIRVERKKPRWVAE